MIDIFYDYYLGKFSNKMQAFSHPSKYAMIELTHELDENGYIRGKQAYYHSKNVPYREFFLKVELFDNNLKLCKFDKNLQPKPECDMLVLFKNGVFTGGVSNCNCMVEWGDKQTYVQSEFVLTPDYYHVIDKGFCNQTNIQIWGSFHGKFEFVRMPL